MSVEALRAHVHTPDGVVRGVDGTAFAVDGGETICLVGESGGGKTMTCDAITGLVDDTVEVTGESASTTRRSSSTVRPTSGRSGATASATPSRTRGRCLTPSTASATRLPRPSGSTATSARTPPASGRSNLLRTVGIAPAESRADEYPHQFSDGMCQRVALTIVLAAEPELLIADKPTSALDATIRARIIDLIDDLRTERDPALLLVPTTSGSSPRLRTAS